MKIVTIIIAVILMFVPILLPDFSSGDDAYTQEPFKLRLTDPEGNDLSDSLLSNVNIYFDTITYETYKVYILKAIVTIESTPARIIIEAEGGQYNLEASIKGAGSFLEDTGLRFTLASGEVFTADMTSENKFMSYFKTSADGVAVFNPNQQYILGVGFVNDYYSEHTPEEIANMEITFQASVAKGFHQMVFISEEKIVATKIVPDGYIVNDVPSVSRSGYDFKGWFLPDGREVNTGFVVTAEDVDIIATAKWESNGDSGFPIIIVIGGIGGALAAAAILFILLKKKKGEEAQ